MVRHTLDVTWFALDVSYGIMVRTPVPARQKLPNQLPTFTLRHALVSLEEPTNCSVCYNLNAVLSKKRCVRNRVFTHYGMKAYKFKVINMFVNKVQIWEPFGLSLWSIMPLLCWSSGWTKEKLLEGCTHNSCKHRHATYGFRIKLATTCH